MTRHSSALSDLGSYIIIIITKRGARVMRGWGNLTTAILASLLFPYRCLISKITREMQVQTTWDATLYLLAGYNKKHSNKCWLDMEKLQPSHITGGNVKWCNCFGEQFTVPQMHSFIIWSNSSTLMGLPERTENMVTCTQTFITVLPITAPKEK